MRQYKTKEKLLIYEIYLDIANRFLEKGDKRTANKVLKTMDEVLKKPQKRGLK